MTGLLVLEGVSKSFDGAAAVTGISFALPAGSRCALAGTGASGKTTLLALVAGALRPDQGSIRFDGREIAGLAPSASPRSASPAASTRPGRSRP